MAMMMAHKNLPNRAHRPDGADEPPKPPPQPRAESSDGAVVGADDPPNPALTASDNPPQPSPLMQEAAHSFAGWTSLVFILARGLPFDPLVVFPSHTQLAALKFCPGASPHRPSPDIFK